jgi:hypothetical protein
MPYSVAFVVCHALCGYRDFKRNLAVNCAYSILTLLVGMSHVITMLISQYSQCWKHMMQLAVYCHHAFQLFIVKKAL